MSGRLVVVWRWRRSPTYDPYGQHLTSTYLQANPFRYASGVYNSTNGLTKFGERYYNPSLGRFTQRDPFGQDLPYTYAG